MFQSFPGFERSPAAGRIALWFMYRICVIYTAQSPHISDYGGILHRAKKSQGKYLPPKQSIMMHVSMYCVVYVYDRCFIFSGF